MAERVYPFSVATHTYFSVNNKTQQKRQFLKDPNHQLEFTYDLHMNDEKLQKRIARVEEGNLKQGLELVRVGLRLQGTPSAKNLQEFRDLNEVLFGVPKRNYVVGLLALVHKKVNSHSQKLWNYVSDELNSGFNEIPDIIPSEMTFQTYKSYFEQYSHDSLQDTKHPLPEMIKLNLDAIGLSKKGWRIVVRDDASHAKIDHYKKVIILGGTYVPRTQRSSSRIVAHEVYGHALRGHQESVAESEGFAILLEQLLGDRFKFRRSLRYLAAGLGWGVVGRPRTFQEVYEILWRVMMIISAYSEEKAKEYAFDECARVFRGGNPNVAGAVYLKDSVYFTANIMMWKRLQDEPLGYNEFIDVIEGRRRLLV